MPIGNNTNDNYQTECFICERTDHLAMVAFRKNSRITGWLFACPNCMSKVENTDYIIRLKEDTNAKDM